MKTCAKCQVEKPLSDFPRHRGKPMGVYASCKGCKALEAKENRLRNGEALRAGSLDWHFRNHERSLANARAYKAEHPEVVAYGGRRYDELKQATPVWADRFLIAEAYRLAKLRTRMLGFPWEVDHVVPIRHPDVCGLHVPANLRVIPRALNREKGNRLAA